MSNNKTFRAPAAKMRAIYMSDEDFALCQRASGGEPFSSWARQALVEAAGAAFHIVGASPGGPCRNERCGHAPNAWWFMTTVKQYICDGCAEMYRASGMEHLLLNRRPASEIELKQQRAERLVRELSGLLDELLGSSSREEIFQRIANAKTE